VNERVISRDARLRNQFSHQYRRWGDAPRLRDGGPRAAGPSGLAPDPHAPSGGGGRAARVPPRNALREDRPLQRPLYDALFEMTGADTLPRLMERGTVEVAPLAYMRGRTLNDAFIILDEAQNTTPEQLKMFLTRIGYGSKAVVNGDATQTDLQTGQLSGLAVVQEILGGSRTSRSVTWVPATWSGTRSCRTSWRPSGASASSRPLAPTADRVEPPAQPSVELSRAGLSRSLRARALRAIAQVHELRAHPARPGGSRAVDGNDPPS
jgi:PhoH-like protein